MYELTVIDFERGEEPLIYRDSLVLPADHGLSDGELEALKDERYAAWRSHLETASADDQVIDG